MANIDQPVVDIGLTVVGDAINDVTAHAVAHATVEEIDEFASTGAPMTVTVAHLPENEPPMVKVMLGDDANDGFMVAYLTPEQWEALVASTPRERIQYLPNLPDAEWLDLTHPSTLGSVRETMTERVARWNADAGWERYRVTTEPRS